MSDTTRREMFDDATRREARDTTRHEGGATRREVNARTRYEDESTRRESGDGTRREGGSTGSPFATAANWGLIARVPSLADRYALDREATLRMGAEGGQAQIGVVRDRGSGELVVLKVYNRGTKLDQRAVDDLIRMGKDPEGSRSILPILDYGVDPNEGLNWEIQEYMPGGSLEELFRDRGTVAPDFATNLLLQLSTALQYIHTRGLTHRDLKPGNILIRCLEPRLNVVIADFGLAMRQDTSVVVRSLAGSWPYLPPESRANEVTPAWDWWAVGLIIAKGLTGRHMFQEANGPLLLADATISNQLAHGTYTVPTTGDARWDLLIAGLLTRDYRHRWSGQQVTDWYLGGTPEVYTPPTQPAVHSNVPQRPFPFAGADYTDLVSLAAAFRTKWQEAGDLLVGRGREELLLWLQRTEAGSAAVPILDRQDLRNPNASLMRLQVILDPATPPVLRGRPLTAHGLNATITEARAGDREAAAWITVLRQDRILSAWAGEADVPPEIRHADDLLRSWWITLDNALTQVPRDQATELIPALEPVLLEAALNPAVRQQILQKGKETATAASTLPSWATPIKAKALATSADPAHAALALATLPAAERTEWARLKGAQEVERRRKSEKESEELYGQLRTAHRQAVERMHRRIDNIPYIFATTGAIAMILLGFYDGGGGYFAMAFNALFVTIASAFAGVAIRGLVRFIVRE